jgi:hypothetical protein
MASGCLGYQSARDIRGSYLGAGEALKGDRETEPFSRAATVAVHESRELSDAGRLRAKLLRQMSTSSTRILALVFMALPTGRSGHDQNPL